MKRVDGKLCEIMIRYLDKNTSRPIDGPAGKALQTIQHVDRFSRKLQRRLTRRTLAEAKALKEQGTEAIHVLIYVAELVRRKFERSLLTKKKYS